MQLSIDDIKLEGKAGLYYAYNSEKVYVAASNAINGETYTCPFCGCRMHVTTTKYGKRIFARNPGEVHTNPICVIIDRGGVEHSFKDLEPEKFITSLCHQVPRTKGPKGKGPAGGENDITPKTDEPENEGGKLAKFTSLKQISESGIEYLNPNDMQGNHKVSEFILTYKYAKDFFSNPNFDLGARIVYARYLYIDSKNRSIIFSLYGKEFSVKFRLIFPSVTDFKSYRDKFGSYKADASTGKTIFEKHRKEQNVLIACDNWIYIPKSRCEKICSPKETYCNLCCGMYQATFTSSKQIYLIPADY